ncbi:MAG: MarR family transcriptional regulator [Alkalicoccus sp.]|nr:MAG: MarR family transcriptional regulator [Alkalicoccus sp.]
MEPDNRNLKAVTVLVKAADAVHGVIKKDAADYGLNPTEFSVMELLHHRGRHPIQLIGKNVLIASSSITYVIDKLTKKQYVVRTACPDDRRVTYAELTEEGTSLMNKIFPEHEVSVNEVFSELEEEEVETLIESLKKIGFKAQKR